MPQQMQHLMSRQMSGPRATVAAVPNVVNNSGLRRIRAVQRDEFRQLI
jgi:hypothetical protein